jgi:hypothetical protein
MLGYLLANGVPENKVEIVKDFSLSKRVLKPSVVQFEKARFGERVYYGIFDNGTFAFLDESDFLLSQKIDNQEIVKSYSGHQFLIETGELKWNSKTRSFKLETAHQLWQSLNQERRAQIIHLKKQLRKAGSTDDFEWIQVSTNAGKGQVVSCQEIFAAQTRGDKYIFSRLLVDNAVFTGTIALRDPSRFVNSEGSDLLAHQYAATNFNAFFAALVGRRLFQSRWGYWRRQSTRMSLGLVSAQIQAAIGTLILDEHQDQGASGVRAQRIAVANMFWTLPSLLKSDLVDKVLLHHAPRWAHNLCLKNSKLAFFVGPGFIRLAEKVAANYAFMAWVSFYSGEDL